MGCSLNGCLQVVLSFQCRAKLTNSHFRDEVAPRKVKKYVCVSIKRSPKLCTSAPFSKNNCHRFLLPAWLPHFLLFDCCRMRTSFEIFAAAARGVSENRTRRMPVASVFSSQRRVFVNGSLVRSCFDRVIGTQSSCGQSKQTKTRSFFQDT